MRAAAFLLVMVFAGAAAAAPRHIEEDLAGARLQGEGVFRYFGLKIYQARLWVAGQRFDPAAPFALELCYARALDGRRIASASADQMGKVGAGTPAQRSAWEAAMAKLFPNVREGDCISGHARQQAPTRFFLNGALVGQIDDPAFGAAFFAIWLSPHTTAPGLRDNLLGIGAGR